jgi:PTH2 family peptidyl-tRNA hydrolase
MPVDTSVKQVILMRKDLKMSAGKVAAQAGHAAVRGYLYASTRKKRLPGDERCSTLCEYWIENGMTKICLQVDSVEQLAKLIAQASYAGLPTQVIIDAGFTELDGPTTTCGVIGPARAQHIDTITGHLKLYK